MDKSSFVEGRGTVHQRHRVAAPGSGGRSNLPALQLTRWKGMAMKLENESDLHPMFVEQF